VEFRQLEAFVAAATELHFGRAAQKLHMSQPTLSDMVRRLERELGTPLLTRTTRRVALTEAGVELLNRADAILEDVRGAAAAVRRIAGGEAGTVRLGITPPVAPALAPHLMAAFAEEAPGVELAVRRMWLPDLQTAIPDGKVDVAITSGIVDAPQGIIGEVFCAEPLVVALRPDHPLAQQDSVNLADLERATLGVHSEDLFPAWSLGVRQVLDAAGVAPPTLELADTDLSAGRWSAQDGVDWIVTTRSVTAASEQHRLIPTSPAEFMPYTLQWCPIRAATAAIGRFVQLALSADVPAGWVTQPDHLQHAER
jgi:DNA-binding transcriptional LysR family regulator